MVVRLNLRAALVALCALVMLLTLYWSRCGDFAMRPGSALLHAGGGGAGAGGGERARDQDIECAINGEYSVACRRDALDGEVYIPFSFIRKYFEIYGKITSTDGVERFEWSHSYSKVYHPKKKYDPRGTFVTFENYNVEVRDRVKCISGIDGVPVSTQWDPRGFYYPTQIAQFGLAHYSKNITEPPPRVRVIEDGDEHKANWVVSEDAVMTREYDDELKANVVRFSTGAAAASRVGLELGLAQDFVLGIDLLLKPNSSMTVVLQHKDKKETFYLHYVTSTQLIYAQEEHTYYGVGTEARWRRLTRDLIVDMQKGWALLDRPKRKAPRNKFTIVGLWLHGGGAAGGVAVSSSSHGAHVLAAARWLVAAQRARGGWPVPARRRVAPAVPDLAPGWHSAMSQGHAISLLARVYHRSGDARCLRAARRALALLDVPVAAGGVKAVWMDSKYIWSVRGVPDDAAAVRAERVHLHAAGAVRPARDRGRERHLGGQAHVRRRHDVTEDAAAALRHGQRQLLRPAALHAGGEPQRGALGLPRHARQPALSPGRAGPRPRAHQHRAPLGGLHAGEEGGPQLIALGWIRLEGPAGLVQTRCIVFVM